MVTREGGAGDGAPPAAARVSRIPRAAPGSRLLRFLLGAALLYWMLPSVLTASGANQVRVAVVVLILIAVYGVIHWIVGRYLGRLNPWLGAVIAVVPLVLVALSGSVQGAAAVLFLGVSLLVIAIRGEPGCEVVAIPAALSGRPTHLACLVFSPLDWLEHRVRRSG